MLVASTGPDVAVLPLDAPLRALALERCIFRGGGLGRWFETQPESKEDSSYWDDESDDDEDRVRTHPLLDAARARWARQEALRPGDRRW